MINSRDLFEQIGFIVDSPSRVSPYKSKGKTEFNEKQFQTYQQVKYKTSQPQYRKPQYITSLQIQLGEDENHILQIKQVFCKKARSFDDPYQLAIRFCKLHNLNQLAVQIVENKIIQAKKREEQKIMSKNQQISSYQSHKKTNPNQVVPNNNCNQQYLKNTPYQKTMSHTQAQAIEKQKSPQKQSRSITPSRPESKKPSVSKSKTKQDKKPTHKKSSHQRSSSTLDKACQNLYFRGILQTKALEQKRIKRQQELQKKEEEELTFKPRINQVSQKIIEFRKQTGTVPIRNPNKIKKEMTEQFYKQLQECTFTPEINPISKIIVHNRSAYRNEDEHFNQLFNNTQQIDGTNFDRTTNSRKSFTNLPGEAMAFCNKKSKQYLLKQKQIEEKELFKPKLNPKSIDQIKLSRAISMKQKIKDGDYMNDEYTFQPQVGRSPFYQPLRGLPSGNNSNKENIPVWEQLYKESQIRAKQKEKLQSTKSRQQLTNASNSQSEFDSFQQDASKISLVLTSKASSSLHYENLIQKRINTVFELLDSDEDGIISPNTIGIENLSKNVLLFLKPIFEEMDELNAQLNYNQFKKAVINLLNDSDPYKKGLFLSEYSKKPKNKPTFAPKINSKSKALAEGRNNSQVHLELYQQGIKNQRKKQFMLQKQRARKQERQLEECSFKPCLHLGRKQYHPSILDKKLSQIQFSVNESNNSGKDLSSYQEDQDDY